MPALWQLRETVDKICPRLGPRLKEVEVIISLAAVCSPDKPLAHLSDFGVVPITFAPHPNLALILSAITDGVGENAYFIQSLL